MASAKRRKLANRIAAGVAILAGLVSGVFLLIEDVPPSAGVGLAISKKSNSVESGCQKACEEPQTTETETTVTSETPEGAGGESVIERALDNQAGVTLIRLLAALLIAFATAAVVRRVLLDLLGGLGDDPTETPAKSSPPGTTDGPGTETPETPEDDDIEAQSQEQRRQAEGAEATDESLPAAAPASRSRHFEI
jgi:hypothetical protein